MTLERIYRQNLKTRRQRLYGIFFTLLLTASTAMEVDAESVHADKVFGPPPSAEPGTASIQKDVEDTSRASSHSNQANQPNQHSADVQSDRLSYRNWFQANIVPLLNERSNSLTSLLSDVSTPPPIYLWHSGHSGRCGSADTDRSRSPSSKGFATCCPDEQINLRHPEPKHALHQLSAMLDSCNIGDRDSRSEVKDKPSDTDKAPSVSEVSSWSWATSPRGSDDSDDAFNTKPVHRERDDSASQIDEEEQSPCPSIPPSSSHTSSGTNSRASSPSNQANQPLQLTQQDIQKMIDEGIVSIVC